MTDTQQPATPAQAQPQPQPLLTPADAVIQALEQQRDRNANLEAQCGAQLILAQQELRLLHEELKKAQDRLAEIDAQMKAVMPQPPKPRASRRRAIVEAPPVEAPKGDPQ